MRYFCSAYQEALLLLRSLIAQEAGASPFVHRVNRAPLSFRSKRTCDVCGVVAGAPTQKAWTTELRAVLSAALKHAPQLIKAISVSNRALAVSALPNGPLPASSRLVFLLCRGSTSAITLFPMRPFFHLSMPWLVARAQSSSLEPEKLGVSSPGVESALGAVYVVAGNLLDDTPFLPSSECATWDELG